MAHRYPNGRRRRPGPAPSRTATRAGMARHSPAGSLPPAFRTFYNVILPGLKGREKREFFNQISAWLILGVALGGPSSATPGSARWARSSGWVPASWHEARWPRREITPTLTSPRSRRALPVPPRP